MSRQNRAVIFDLFKLGLDPKKKYKDVDKNGHLIYKKKLNNSLEKTDSTSKNVNDNLSLEAPKEESTVENATNLIDDNIVKDIDHAKIVEATEVELKTEKIENKISKKTKNEKRTSLKD